MLIYAEPEYNGPSSKATTLLAHMIKNGLYNFIGGAFRIGIAIISVPILIRLIGIEQYGLWTLVSATVSIVILAEAGLSTSTTFFLSGDLANNDNVGFSENFTIIFWTIICLASCALGIMWFGAGTIVNLFPNLSSSQRTMAIQASQIGGVVAWSRMIQQIFVGVEQVYDRYDLINILNIGQAIFFRSGLLFVAWRGGSIVSMMLWQALVSIVIMIIFGILVWSLLRQNQIRFKIKWERMGQVLRYSLMTWFSSIGGTFFGQFDRLAVGLILSPVQLGLYGAITDMTRQINFISALPAQPLLPAVAHAWSKQQLLDLDLRKKIRQGFQINALVALGLGSVMLCFSPLIMTMVMSEVATEPNLMAFRIAILVYSLYSLNAVGYFMLLGSNRVRLNMIIVAVSGLCSLLAIAVGAVYGEMLGSIIGNSIYMGTILLTIVGFQMTNIKFLTALNWINVPLTCFAIVYVLSMSGVIDTFEIQIFVTIVLFITLCLWVIKSQNFKPRLMVNKMVQKLYSS